MSEKRNLDREQVPARSRSVLAQRTPAQFVNPLDAKHVVTVERIARRKGALLSARVSFDGGRFWRSSWPIPTTLEWENLTQPALAMDVRGNLHMAAVAHVSRSSRTQLVVFQSSDGGIHWHDPSVVLESPSDFHYSMAGGLTGPAASAKCVFLVADAGGTLSFARSSADVEATQWITLCRRLWPGACHRPHVLVDQSGIVHVVWLAGPSGRAILAVRSTDGGDSFSDPMPVADGVAALGGGLMEDKLATCFCGNTALCVWADNREAESRIYCRRSIDGGRTWLGQLDGEPLLPEASPGQQQLQPRLQVTSAGEICCAFYEYGPKTPGGPPLMDLVMAVSYDSGATFGGKMVLSGHSWDPGFGQGLSRGAC